MRIVRGMLGAGLVLAAIAGCCLFPETATLIINNNSSHVVDEVYITPVGSPDLGNDWLPASTTIDPGDSYPFRRIDPGTFDVRICDVDGGEWVSPGLVLDPGAEITLPLVDLSPTCRVMHPRQIGSLRIPASRGCTQALRTAA
jgi:hypothetical protein